MDFASVVEEVALVAGIEGWVVVRRTGRGVGGSCVRSGLLELVVTRARGEEGWRL